jgi:hypothetical protein
MKLTTLFLLTLSAFAAQKPAEPKPLPTVVDTAVPGFVEGVDVSQPSQTWFVSQSNISFGTTTPIAYLAIRPTPATLVSICDDGAIKGGTGKTLATVDKDGKVTGDATAALSAIVQALRAVYLPALKEEVTK